jgi:DNA-binding winged helix-turn-helix (wHTH) protein/Tfp pilus assembly protein PilF
MSGYVVGPFRLDAEKLLLMRGREPVALGPKVVETLLALIEHPGDVLTKSQLVDRIWPEGYVEEANLAQNIYVLRKTFRQHGCADPIETVPRRGYRFTAPVSRAPGPPPENAPAGRRTALPAPRARHALAHRTSAALAGMALLAASVVLIFSDGIGHRGAVRGTLSAAGLQSYQIGRYQWNLRTRDGVRKSLTYFARVVNLDPEDARGYAALADANVAMGEYCYGTHQPSVYFARAQEYATRALALDPNSAEAHAALGILALERNDVTPAMTELRRAIVLDRSYGPAHEWYGIALVQRGRLAEGVGQLKIAADLDPLSVATTAWLGSAAYRQRRYGEAVTYARQALELAPKRTDVLATLGEAYEAQGDIDRAIQAFKRYGAVGAYYRPQAAALLAHAYALGGHMPEARAELAYARALASNVDPFDLAAAATVVGGGSAQLPERRTAHATMYA